MDNNELYKLILELQNKFANLEQNLKINNQIFKNDIKEKILETNKYLDEIDDTFDRYDKALKEVTNDNELLFNALVNMKMNVDSFINAQIKEKIMNTAIVTVIAVELLSSGIIDSNQYSQMVKNIINQISDMYKQAGQEIDLTAELAAFDSANNSDSFAIHIPTIMSSRVDAQPINKNSSININLSQEAPFKEASLKENVTEKSSSKKSSSKKSTAKKTISTNNIIHFNDIIEQQKKQNEINLDKLYNIVSDKLINKVLTKEDKKPKKKRTLKRKKKDENNDKNGEK